MLPGDFVLVDVQSPAGMFISAAQSLDNWLDNWLNHSGAPLGNYEHAAIYLGGGRVLEARPSGAGFANIANWHTEMLWSSDLVPLTPVQRGRIITAALSYRDVQYSYLDYLAIATHRLHIRTPGLRQYIASSKHMICSQLVDQCYQDAGIELFADKRWAGYVTPNDLFGLLENRRLEKLGALDNSDILKIRGSVNFENLVIPDFCNS